MQYQSEGFHAWFRPQGALLGGVGVIRPTKHPAHDKAISAEAEISDQEVWPKKNGVLAIKEWGEQIKQQGWQIGSEIGRQSTKLIWQNGRFNEE